jgi:hypothetical protein
LEVADAVVALSVLEHLREPQTMLDEPMVDHYCGTMMYRMSGLT